MKRTAQSGILDCNKGLHLVGATYRENSGDRVIADCLQWAVRQTSNSLTITHLDLARRTMGGVKSDYGRALILRFVDRLPSSVGMLSLPPTIAKAERSGSVKIAPAPRTGRELARTVADRSLIMAHRLHACMLRYAFGRLVISLSWGTKLRSSFASVGLVKHEITQALVLAHDVVGAVHAALCKGVNLEARDKSIDECRAGMAKALEATLA